jgi:preprotein translocase subunit SecY
MLSSIANIFRIHDLRKKVLITVLLLIVCRIAAQVPTPGVDGEALDEFYKKQHQDAGGAATLWSLINIFSGGAFRRVTILALGIMPYISASIIIQLLSAVIPSLEKLAKEGGDEGRKKITQYTRYGTVLLCAFQAYFMGAWVQNSMGSAVVPDQGPGFRLLAMVAMTTGTMFLMWLGEIITEHGIGNGISLIITVGIISRLPAAVVEVLERMSLNPSNINPDLGFTHLVFLLGLFVFVVGGVILLTQGTRRIPVQYAKRVVGRKIYSGQSSYLPLRVNYAGVIPIIFASSILMFPATIAQWAPVGFLQTLSHKYLQPHSVLYISLYVLMIIFFCYFWTATQFDPTKIANDMKKNGAFVPGIRPGKPTSDFLEFTMNRITFSGAIFLAVVAILPEIITNSMGLSYNISQFFGGTSLLIIVGVLLDTLQAIESHLLMRHYDGLTKRGKLRGRK